MDRQVHSRDQPNPCHRTSMSWFVRLDLIRSETPLLRTGTKACICRPFKQALSRAPRPRQPALVWPDRILLGRDPHRLEHVLVEPRARSLDENVDRRARQVPLPAAERGDELCADAGRALIPANLID